jgi:acyl-coenzyme A synthetase/AMP-(fatty) acid ligase
LRPAGVPPTECVVYSGDLVRRDAEGRLYYIARRDRMIKTLGYRVSPDEVCDTLLASGLVREAAVNSEPDAQRGERIVGHIRLQEGATVIELKQFCGLELPRYMQPSRYECYDALPRNAAGKIDLLSLRGAGKQS